MKNKLSGAIFLRAAELIDGGEAESVAEALSCVCGAIEGSRYWHFMDDFGLLSIHLYGREEIILSLCFAAAVLAGDGAQQRGKRLNNQPK